MFSLVMYFLLHIVIYSFKQNLLSLYHPSFRCLEACPNTIIVVREPLAISYCTDSSACPGQKRFPRVHAKQSRFFQMGRTKTKCSTEIALEENPLFWNSNFMECHIIIYHLKRRGTMGDFQDPSLV